MFSKADIERYFTAEKSESLVFIIIGLSAIVAAIILYFFLKTNFHKGMAYPLLLIAIIQITVGYTVYKRSDSDRKRNSYAYDMNPAELRNKEIPRMLVVKKNFVIYRWIEIMLLLTGLVLFFLWKNNPDKAFWTGVGMGLAIQAAIMLCADYVAEARAITYTKGLQDFIGKNL